MTMRFGIGSPVFRPCAAVTPATMAPPWMRQEELRTVACMRPSTTAWIAGGIASTPPIRIPVRPCAFMTLAAASAMSSLWKNAASIFGNVLRYRSHSCAVFCDVPIRRIGRQDLDTGKLVDDRLEAFGASLRAGMSERALRHDDRALAADGVHERLCDRGAHELVVGSKEREDVDLIERRDQRVHVNHRDPGLNHPDDRRGDRVDVHRLDGDEVPLFGRDLLDESQLFHGRQLSQPGDVDVEQPAPVLGGLFPFARTR